MKNSKRQAAETLLWLRRLEMRIYTKVRKAHPESPLLVPGRRRRGLCRDLQIRPHPGPSLREGFSSPTQRFGKPIESPLLPVPEQLRRRSLCGCKSDHSKLIPPRKAFDSAHQIEKSASGRHKRFAHHVDATKAGMRSATAQNSNYPSTRSAGRSGTLRHEPEHPSPTTATFMRPMAILRFNS